MRITSAGDVGIGTDNPGSPLDVRGTSSEPIVNFGDAASRDSEGTNLVGSGAFRYQFQNGASNRPSVIEGGGDIAANEGAVYFTGFASGQDTNHKNLGGILIFRKNTGNSNQNGSQLQFRTKADNTTSSTTRMVIDSSGNVGIGDTSPSHTLVVKGVSGTSPIINVINSDTEDNDTGRESTIRFSGFRSGGEAVDNGQITGTHDGSSDDDKGMLTFFTNGGSGQTEKMRITSAGNVGINVTNPTAAKLQIETSANGERCADFNHSESSVDSQDEIMRCRFSGTGAPAGGRFIAFEDSQARTGMIQMDDGDNVAYTVGSSDINTKKNFEDWDENVLEHFKTLKPKRFHYKRQEDSKPKNKGYIAQDVKDAFPEAYPLSGFKEEGEEKQYYGFNPSGMVVYLMKAVQELSSQIDVLKSQISGSSDFTSLKTAVSGSN
jgi:hypothetical protein